MSHLSSVSVEDGQAHWRRRELETKQRQLHADSEQLRILYAELVVHYQKMGALFDIQATEPVEPWPFASRCDLENRM